MNRSAVIAKAPIVGTSGLPFQSSSLPASSTSQPKPYQPLVSRPLYSALPSSTATATSISSISSISIPQPSCSSIASTTKPPPRKPPIQRGPIGFPPIPLATLIPIPLTPSPRIIAYDPNKSTSMPRPIPTPIQEAKELGSESISDLSRIIEMSKALQRDLPGPMRLSSSRTDVVVEKSGVEDVVERSKEITIQELFSRNKIVSSFNFQPGISNLDLVGNSSNTTSNWINVEDVIPIPRPGSSISCTPLVPSTTPISASIALPTSLKVSRLPPQVLTSTPLSSTLASNTTIPTSVSPASTTLTLNTLVKKFSRLPPPRPKPIPTPQIDIQTNEIVDSSTSSIVKYPIVVHPPKVSFKEAQDAINSLLDDDWD